MAPIHGPQNQQTCGISQALQNGLPAGQGPAQWRAGQTSGLGPARKKSITFYTHIPIEWFFGGVVSRTSELLKLPGAVAAAVCDLLVSGVSMLKLLFDAVDVDCEGNPPSL